MIKRKLYILTAILFATFTNSHAQQTLSLEECRNLAIENNKKLKIASEQERKAHYEKKEAFMKYFPNFSASATYMHFSDNLHLVGKDAIPAGITLPPQLGGMTIPLPKDDIYKATEIDMSNFWVLGVSLTQPIFTGGRIVALNDIRKYAQDLASLMKETTMTDVIVEVDEAYWQVVSLTNKTKLAESYVELLSKMDSDVNHMLDEGVATKADRLSVNVKLNEAEITLTKAQNGLSLSKMLLCEIMGLEISDKVKLADENIESIQITERDLEMYDIDAAIHSRSEIRSLAVATSIYKKQEKLALAEFLPTAGLSVGHTWINPSLEDGVQKKFGGMWNVAVNVKVPLNFISSSAKLKAAKSETFMREYDLEEAKEKIKLQINQSSYKLAEANKKLKATTKNTEKANENLRYANVGFEEGVIPASDALAAHTAWIAAHSEMIDAQIDLKLCKLYLDKALGRKIR